MQSGSNSVGVDVSSYSLSAQDELIVLLELSRLQRLRIIDTLPDAHRAMIVEAYERVTGRTHICS